MTKRLLLLFAGLSLWLFLPQARGQILFTASLDGSQETPAVTTNGQGTAWALLSSDMKTLTYRLTFARLDTTATAAHFHSGPSGVPGPVVNSISLVGNSSSGTWTDIPDSLLERLLKGEIYLNVHSIKHGAGEIRGQLMSAAGMGFTIAMDGAQETPSSVQTGATGTGFAFFNADTANTLVFRVTFAGLSDTVTASHFHVGPVGVGGSVIHPVPVSDSTVTGTWTFPDSIYAVTSRGNLYYNVHTKAHQGGEIRGQLLSVTGQRFTIVMDGSQETAPVTTPAKGSGYALLSPDGSSLIYRFTFAQLESTYTASHFHVGAPGVGGPVVKSLAPVGNTASDTWTGLPDSIVARLLQGNVYLNVHSREFPLGEVRGQLFPETAPVFIIGADAGQESPPTALGGKGSGFAVLDSNALLIYSQVTIAGMSDTLTAAHFHAGPAGVPGPVVHAVTFVDSTTTGNWTGFPDSVIAELLKGNLYFNAHTKAHQGGEIRGQVLWLPGTLTSVQQIPGAAPAAFRLEQNYPNPFNPSTAIRFSLSTATHVTLKVYNLLGQETATLVNEFRAAGAYQTTFDARSLASGVYFYRLTLGTGQTTAEKMLLLR